MQQSGTFPSNGVAAVKDVADETHITPANLKRTMTNASISSTPTVSKPELSSAPGYRAAEAFVRPTPTVVAGKVTKYGFDLRKCEFALKFDARDAAAADDAPTVVFLPEFHFPRDRCTVEVSSGRWEIVWDDGVGDVDDSAVAGEEGAEGGGGGGGGLQLQWLRWWHDGKGEQTLKVNGLVRQHNVQEGTAEELGYLQQCYQYGFDFGNCNVM